MAYPYYNQPYMNYGNQYYQQSPMQQPMQQQIPQAIPQPLQQTIQPQQVYKPSLGLQGKSVDSLDVVKAMDIPLDGTISYFPIADGSAIVSKQLQMDGTSKTIIYEPIKEENKEENKTNVIGINEELTNQIKLISQDNISLKSSINSIKDEIQDISNNFSKLFEEMKNLKGGKR